jgi:hypothetical protein
MPPDAVQTVQLEVLPKGNADADPREVKRPQFGRPLYLTPRRFIAICRLIEQGESASESCRRELISYRVFRLHVVRFPSYQRRLKRAEEIRESFLKEEHMANVRAHAPRSLLASLWWLERRHPQLFALRAVNRADPEAKQAEPELPAEILERHKQLMLSMLREDQQKHVSGG